LKGIVKILIAGTILIMAKPIVWDINATDYKLIRYVRPDNKDQKDTSKRDTSQLKFPFKDNSGGLETKRKSPLYLNDPSNIEQNFEYNPKTKQFEYSQKIGALNYRNPSAVGLEEYKNYDFDNAAANYWRQRYSADKVNKQGSGAFSSFLNPKFNVQIEGIDRIFGTNVIDIKPQGSAELILGINISKIEKPDLPLNQQRHTSFDFQEKIQMGVTGSVGDKMKLGINYNTESVFDFENQAKLGYTGKEDEIIKNIEAGNVSLPLNGTLITGAHSLFGLKTELQFGKLNVTTVISQQKGQSSVVEMKNGAQTRDFKIYADDYDANRHFFLGHFFRDNYEKWIEGPAISSGITIKKIEVWVTNKINDKTDNRNVLAFMDLGENRNPATGENNFIGDVAFIQPSNIIAADNKSNGLYEEATSAANEDIRELSKINSTLTTWNGGNFKSGRNYEKIERARKLKPTEYTVNENLGYISLKSSLNADEVLAVAYQYTVASSQVYQVGEFSTDRTANVLFVKLLKNTSFSPRLKNWKLMMKNVYSVNSYQLQADQFKLNIMYQNDKTGTAINYIPDGNIKQKQLLQVYELDKVNSQKDPQPDGVFDFLPGITVNQSDGRIFFPVLEPFGTYLRKQIGNDVIADKYVYQELYDSTQTKAKQFAERNKFFLQGSYSSTSSSEISLNAWNVPKGSVVVTANGIKLEENIDYTVDYALGKVTIINNGILQSGQTISVSLENNSNFNLTNKTMLGTRLDYKFNPRFQLGGTILHLSEKPLTNKVGLGDEPISNTIWGLDGTYSTKSPFLTKLVDRLPFIETKEMSTITMTGEFAHLIPGHSKRLEKGGVAFIDDFDAAKATIDLRQPSAWTLASTPQGQPRLFPEAELTDSLPYGYNRALLAWYVINSDMVRSTQATPGHLSKTDQSNHFVREVFEKDLFPDRQSVTGYPTPLQVINLAYYPTEKGPYNFDVTPSLYSRGINEDGSLRAPQTRWAGIMRKIPNSDFETANYGYIEFWMMDPFVYGSNPGNDAKLYFNLGNISEDVLKDSRKSFENGLPIDDVVKNVDETHWGRVPTTDLLTNAFDPKGQNNQDVGLDGLKDQEEASFFKRYLDRVQASFGTGSEAYGNASQDPSSDNYHFFRGSDFDKSNTSILDRYKRYNGLEGNSPTTNNSPESYPTSATQSPNMEGNFQDQTLNETESYFQYSVKLRKEDFVVGKNYITNVVEDAKERRDGNFTSVKWYQFKIPVFEPEESIGEIQDFKSIRFMRLFMRGCEDTTILRFAKFELLRDEWRRYNFDLTEGHEDLSIPQENDANFEISAVNIEENGSKTPIHYVLPPGVTREVEPSNNSLRQLNEQSMVLKVRDLEDGDAKAAYKNVDIDVRQYKRMKMFVHAEQIEQERLSNGDVSIFVRLGADFKENYYEYEIPLHVTPIPLNISDEDKYRDAVWPSSNEIEIEFEDFQNVKQERNTQMNTPGSSVRINKPFFMQVGNKRIKVIGNPNLSNIKSILIGVRNPSKSRDIQFTGFTDDGVSKSTEIWVNELRLTDFNEKGGWAATGRITTKLADFASVTLSGNTSKPGWGSLEKKVNERQKEDIYQYNVTANAELGKFFPQKYEVHIPMYVGISESFSNPQYDPLNPDLEFSKVLESASASERKELKNRAQDYQRRKSINFTNVKVNNPQGLEKAELASRKVKIYSISNFALTYAHNEIFARNINTEYNTTENYTGAINYNFNSLPKNLSPFKSWKLFRPQAMTLLRDFNFYPSPKQISIRSEINRQYQEIKLRNISNPDLIIQPTFKKEFLWNRSYDIKWDFSRSLRFDFLADNYSRIDEPDGRIDTDQKRDTIWNNLKNFGRTTEYHHRLNASWMVPINKIPILNWVNVTAKYSADYYWNAGPQNMTTSDGTPINYGNTIKNSNNEQVTGELNFTNLYNKVKFFSNIQRDLAQGKQGAQKEEKQFVWEQTNVKLKAGKPYLINHRMDIEKVDIQVVDEKGGIIRGTITPIDKNKVSFISPVDAKKVTIRVSGRKVPQESTLSLVGKHLVGVLLGVKRASITYTETNGTTLPGYLPSTRLVGMNKTGSQFAPGMNFILGIPDEGIASRAAMNNWLTSDTLISDQSFIMTKTKNLNGRITIEPLQGFRIELMANRSVTQNMSEEWRKIDGNFKAMNREAGGSNFKISVNMLATAFEKFDDNYNNEVFQKFKEYRKDIAWRLAAKRKVGYDPNNPLQDEKSAGYPYGYGPLSQEAMIPALLAAYTGKSPDKIGLSAFPAIPQINWRITIDGLTKYDFFKRFFRSFVINHNYVSTYTVGSYSSDLEYMNAETALDGLKYQMNDDNKFVPEFLIAGVSLREEFSPMINIDMTWLNSLSTKVEFKRVRDIALGFSNSQMIEQRINELVVGAGYRLNKLPLNFLIGGKVKKLPSDLNLRADFSFKDYMTVIRKIEDDINQLSDGNRNISIKFSADYALDKNLNIRFFYDQNIMAPKTSIGYPTSNTKIGFSVRFTIIN
jgi:cell surface protein SprA